LFLFSISSSNHFFRGCIFSPFSRFLFWRLISNFFLLTWLGACPAESPFTEVSLVLTVSYFLIMSLIVIWPHLTNYYYLN
jgi:quinol-cytochrome oxidoreductase complex cytochrome b subunit